MAGMNIAILSGRVGQEPEILRFQSGDEVANFTLATSESWTDKRNGYRKEKTEWHKIKVLGEGNVKIVRQYVNKGDRLGIEGTIQYRQWDKDGEKRYATEIVVGPFRGRIHLIETRGEREGGGRGRDDDRGRRDRSRDDDRRRDDDRGRSRRTLEQDLDDEIPF